MIKRILSISKTATFKDTGIVFTGNAFSAILGAFFFFYLARVAGANNFGIISTSLAAMLVLTDLFDVALNTTIVNFASKKQYQTTVLKLILKRKLLFAFIVAPLLALFAHPIANLLGHQELAFPLRLAAIGIPLKVLYTFVKAALQSNRQFIFDAIAEVSGALFRLLIFILFFHICDLPVVASAILAYSLGLGLAFLIALPRAIKLLREKISISKDFHASISRYQSWLTLSFVATAISGRLDIFALTRLGSLTAVGLYEAAFKLFIPVQQLSGSLSRVFAPRFASIDKKQFSSYFKKTIWLSIGLALATLATLPILKPAILLLYGPEFLPTVSYARILIFYFALFILSTPWWSHLLYHQSDAKRFTFLSILQLSLLVVLLPVGIIKLGGLGAPIALVTTQSILFIPLLLWTKTKN